MKEMQEMLFDSLTDVYKGHLDVHLLTPVNLLKQIDIISGKLPKSLSLPLENAREDIKNLYKLLYAKARVTSNYFLFEIHIPLTSDEDFLLYKAIPLPVKTDNKQTIVHLQSQYIAVNFEKSTFISIAEDDVKLCSKLKLDIFICYKNMPVFNLHNNKAPCEAKLLSHRSSAPCDLKVTSCSDAWIALHTPNSWLAICCGDCTLRTVCRNDVTSHTITTTSIVTLAQGCVLQSRDFTIYSHNEYNTKMKMDNFNINIPDLNSTVNNVVDISHRRLALPSFDTSEEIQEIDRKIKTLKEKEVLPSISSHDIHQYALGYSLLGAALIGIIVWVIIKKRSCIPILSCPCCNKKEKRAAEKPTYEEIELQHMKRHVGQEHVKRSADRPPPPPAQRPGPRATTMKDNIAFNFDD